MKLQKLTRMICAGCLLLTAISITGTAAPSSAYAGQTITCQVISLDDGASAVVSVEIPANATQAEENTLMALAIAEPAEARAARALPSISDFTNVRVNAATGNEANDTLVGSGIAPIAMKTVYVVFNNPLPANGAKSVTVRVHNNGTNTTRSGGFDLGSVTTHVAFTSNSLGVLKGDLVTAYAATDAGYMTSELCQFYGTPN